LVEPGACMKAAPVKPSGANRDQAEAENVTVERDAALEVADVQDRVIQARDGHNAKATAVRRNA
jgi:hypothetical protein